VIRGFEGQFIEQVDAMEYSFDVMKTVFPFPEDPESEIDLGVRSKNHGERYEEIVELST
jgi:hypothetical protein